MGWVFAGLGLLWDMLKRVMRDYMDSYFFSFLILPEKTKNKVRKKVILLAFLPENIRSSGDDDSSSGDDDSSSGDDDSSSCGVLIWFSLFIIHNYKLLYCNVIFLV